MKTNRVEFLSRLQSVQAGLAKRELMDQSTCFVFSRGSILTYNDEIFCRIKSGLPKDVVGAVAAKPLLAILEKIPDEEVEVEVTDSEVVLTGKMKMSRLRMEADIDGFLKNLSGLEEPTSWKDLPADFEEAVGIVASCASTNTELTLNSVHLTSKFLEACDNVQMSRYKIKMPIKEPFLVRSGSLRYVVSLGMTEFSESESWLHFRNAKGLTLSCRRFMDEYNKMDRFLEVEGSPVVLPTGLEEAVMRAEVFSSENSDNNKLSVELRSGKCKLKGEGVTGEYQEIKRLTYKGPPLSFLVSPKMLMELSKRTNECVVAENRLKVTAEKWAWVGCLAVPESKTVKEPVDVEQDADASEE